MTQAIRGPQATALAPDSGVRWGVRVLDGLLVVLLLVLLACASYLVFRITNAAEIQSVRISGEFQQLRKDDLARLLSASVRGNFFTVDLGAVRRAASQSPWVESVAVSRSWPDGLVVEVSERKPVARWGNTSLISASGQLFTPSQLKLVDGLPILFGPESKAAYVMEQYRAMNAMLRPASMKIVELQLTERMAWFLRLDSGIVIVVDQQNTLSKLQRFTHLFIKQLAPDVSNIATIDLRYRNGVSVGWRPEKILKNSAKSV